MDQSYHTKDSLHSKQLHSSSTKSYHTKVTTLKITTFKLVLPHLMNSLDQNYNTKDLLHWSSTKSSPDLEFFFYIHNFGIYHVVTSVGLPVIYFIAVDYGS